MGGGITISTSLVSCNKILDKFQLDLCDLKAGDNIQGKTITFDKSVDWLNLFYNSELSTRFLAIGNTATPTFFDIGYLSVGYAEIARNDSSIILYNTTNGWKNNKGTYLFYEDYYSNVEISQIQGSGGWQMSNDLLFLDDLGLRGWAIIE